MTDPNDPWSSLADELGVDGSSRKPAEEKAPAAGRGRRRKSDGEEPGRGRRRSPKVAPTEVSESPLPDEPFVEPEAPEAAAVAEEAAEGDDGPKKKRRRRTRRKKAGANGESGTEMTSAVESECDDGDEPDLTPIEDYATWKLPSWQELIDGLHKSG